MSVHEGSWPLVGRDEMLDDLDALLDDGIHVVLAAPAGAGKTRIADELIDRCRERGVIARRIVASPATRPLPLAPFAVLLDGRVEGDPVTGVLDALGADGRAGPGDPVLLVDDAHLLDDTSSVVLHQLLTSGRVRIVATIRSTADLPPAVARLRREPRVRTVEVPPLTDEHVVTMVEAGLSGRLDGRSRVLITSSAAGNPLYARELVLGSIESGTLRRAVDVWSFRGELAATPALAEVVQARLAPLDDACRDALELLAIGGALPVGVLASLVGPTAVERLERSGLVVASGPSTGGDLSVDIAHPLYRDLTHMHLGPLARRRLYERLAETAPPSSTAHEELRIVLWHLRGGKAVDADRLVDAAHRAGAIGDPTLAAELAEAAFAATGGAKPALLASWNLSVTGRHDDAIALLRRALDSGPRSGTTPWEMTAMQLRISEELWWTGRTDEGARELATPRAAGDGPWDDLMTAQRGVFAMLDGRIGEALDTARPLLDHAHVWVRFVAAVAAGPASTFADDADGSIRIADEVLAGLDGHESELLGESGIHVATRMMAMIYGGACDAGLALAELAYDASVNTPSVQARAWTAMIRGLGAATVGRNAEAVRFFAEGEALWAENGLEGIASWCAAGLALSQASQGAAGDVRETVARMDGYHLDGFRLYDPVAHTARAWAAAMSGRDAEAEAHIREALAGCVVDGDSTHRFEVALHAARLGVVAPLDDVARWTPPVGDLADAQWRFAVARVDDDASALENAGERLEALGALLFAAEAFALAASRHRRSAAHKQAARCDGRAGALLGRCVGASTPALGSRRTTTGPLSVREREISALAATGMTNRQIADRLVVSERTIENHLYRVFAKLGITSRDQLT